MSDIYDRREDHRRVLRDDIDAAADREADAIEAQYQNGNMSDAERDSAFRELGQDVNEHYRELGL